MPTSDDHDVGVPDDGLDGEFRREVELLTSLSSDPVELVDAPEGTWARLDDALGAGAPATTETVRRGGRRAAVLVAVAAAVVSLVVGIAVLVQRPSSPAPVASATLLPYGGAAVGDAGGTVELVREDGRLRLHVDMHDIPAPEPGTFYEMWLIDPTTDTPVSVASMEDGAADVSIVLDVPDGIDRTSFDVVDVSVQSVDAGPAHSGRSVLRGTLEA